MLAVSVGGDIQFFSVESLLSKEQKPSSFNSLNDSNCVKDMQWIKKVGNSYVVLSSQGKLYHGAPGSTLKEIMENVDAVEWSVNGSLIAVARSHILSILSSKFRERLSMSLLFKSLVKVKCNVKVDSIRWVQPDCIIIGCLQVASDGIEDNYYVLVITTNGGKLIDDSSSPVVLSFCDSFPFPGLIDDIVPFGSGPHLLLSYLEQCELAITANRKNTKNHIALIAWSKGDEMSKGKAVGINIYRETWVPEIDFQDNLDMNLVLGVSVDELCPRQKFTVKHEDEEEKELSPCCVLFCLTLDGKLVMFDVASDAKTVVEPSIDSIFPDVEEEDVTPSSTFGT